LGESIVALARAWVMGDIEFVTVNGDLSVNQRPCTRMIREPQSDAMSCHVRLRSLSVSPWRGLDRLPPSKLGAV
jgi:hypothetical protein